MKNLKDRINEGFFSNVGAGVRDIQEWMKGFKFSRYYDYRISKDVDSCKFIIHYDKHNTNRKDIIIDVKEIWDRIKVLSPACDMIRIDNKHTLAFRPGTDTDYIHSDIFFKNHKGDRVWFTYDANTKKLEYKQTYTI